MQSWPNSGQNGADTPNSWSQNFGFGDQNGSFDPGQAWSQSVVDESSPYSHINPQDATTSNYFESAHEGNAYLSGTLHNSPPHQASFHGGHGNLDLGQQYSQPTADSIDPAFSNIHQDLYAQPGKLNLGDTLNHLGPVPKHPHAHSQVYVPHDYAFPTQNEQPFDTSVSQYTSPQLLSQTSRQQSHTPVQQFEELATGFPQDHGFSQSPQQQQPFQHQHQQQIHQPHHTFPQRRDFASPANGQPTPFHPNSPSHLNYQQPAQNFGQSSFSSTKQNTFLHQTHGSPDQQSPQAVQQRIKIPPNQPSPATSQIPHPSPKQLIAVESAALQQPVQDSAPKKRKRTTKSTSVEAPVVESPATPIDLTIESPLKKVEDVDAIAAPVPSPEEVQIMTQFSKRSKAAQAKQPSIKGLPHFIYDGTVKLPAPKSYDKLAPLVALPPRSGKSMVPQLVYSLPCEVQGRFTAQYRPSADKAGLDERRTEAKSLLDEYDRSMSSLGKRRPKYTEYPHAFKEQLKSDEASKNKAEKRAKKELEDERSKPTRPVARPTDPVEAAAWDIVSYVQVEASTAKTNVLIASRVQQAGDLLIKLRSEMNRSRLELDQAIKDKDPANQITKIKEEAELKKNAFYKALDATIEHADDAVLDNLGGHQKLILSLVNALIACIKAADFSSKLPKIVLELFTHFRMTLKIAETTNFDTVLKRFGDKGDKEVKELISEISSQVKKVKGAESDAATGYTGTSAASRAKSGIKAAPEGPSSKRSREQESDTRTVKKIVVESGTGSLSKKLAQPKIQSQASSKTAATKSMISSLLPGKPKSVAKPAIKSELAGADSPSASADEKGKAEVKRPHTKLEPGKTTVSKTEIKPPIPKSSTAPTSSALSGIASLLDSINAPRAEPIATSSKELKNLDVTETPSQTAKRLRKEARRKLRVSWKPEGELVQVKIFHKDVGEDEGREVNLIRDAADDRSEGMVLKQRADVEEDDDDDEIPYIPWLEPVSTDFSNLPADARNKNYVTRGGHVTFTTDEQQHIAERERRELMALYTDPDDIPPSPKSPPPETSAGITGQRVTELPSNDEKFTEILLRWKEERQMGSENALLTAVQRLNAKHNPANKLDSILGRLKSPSASSNSSQLPHSNSHAQQASLQDSLPLTTGSVAEEQVLGWLRSDKIAFWQGPSPTHINLSRTYSYADATLKMVGNAVEMAARELAGKPHPATAPPEWIMKDEERVREWWVGYEKEAGARQKRVDDEQIRAKAESDALRAAAATHQTQGNPQDWSTYSAHQQAYAPYMALLQQMTGGQQAAPATTPAPSSQLPTSIPDNQLQSILAAINQTPEHTSQSQAPNPSSYLNPNDPSYQQLMMLKQMTQGQQTSSSSHGQGHSGDRDWEREDAYGRMNDQYRDGKDGRKKKPTLPPHKPANKALIGTKPCTFWQQGKCARGEKCTFRHD